MVKVTGHRGCAGLEPENTLRAFERAIELKVDIIEMDVQLSKDSKLVVVHDDTVDRTTDGKGKVSEMTLEELRLLDAGKGEKIPALEDVVNIAKEKINLQIELKGPGTEKPVVDLVKKEGMEDSTILTSFESERIALVRKIGYNGRTGLLLSSAENAKGKVESCNASNLHLRKDLVTKEIVDTAHKNGLEFHVWGGVDDPEEAVQLAKMGVDGIGSNYPDRILKALRF